ncbi:MAG: hypothetical protein RL692_945, partial [Planctomycetota bacterium]
MQKKTCYRNVPDAKAKHYFALFPAVLMLLTANYAIAQASAPAPTINPSDRTVPARRPTPPVRPNAVEPRAIADALPLVSEPANMDFGFLSPNTPGEGIVLLRNTS